MKIAVTSKSFSKNAHLRQQLLEVYPQVQFNDQGLSFTDDQLIDFLKDCEKAIIGLEKVNEKILTALPKLKIISKYGVGCDNIQFEALAEKGVLFGYTAGTNKRGVSELALQMMLVLLRKSYQANLLLRQNQWAPQFGNNLTGKTVGIVGLGNVGRDLVGLLEPFQCKILGNDIKPDPKYMETQNIKPVSLEEIFSQADIITLHIPLNKSTRCLISEKLFSSMKEGSILINTSRGGIVDETSLLNHLTLKKTCAAGFDVFEQEPVQNEKLLKLENFFSTPHIGGSSIESVISMGMAAIAGLDKAKPVSEYDFT